MLGKGARAVDPGVPYTPTRRREPAKHHQRALAPGARDWLHTHITLGSPGYGSPRDRRWPLSTGKA